MLCFRSEASEKIPIRVRQVAILSLEAFKNIRVSSANPNPAKDFCCSLSPSRIPSEDDFSNIQNREWVATADKRGLKGQPCLTDLLMEMGLVRKPLRENINFAPLPNN